MRDFWSAFGRYSEVASWLIRDSYWRFPAKFFAAIVLSGASLASQFAALGTIYRYLRAVETNSALVILDQNFSAQSLPVLLMTAGIVLFLFGGGIFLRYLSRVTCLQIGRAYEEYCSKRAIVLIRERGIFGPRERRAIHSEPRLCGRIVRILLDAAVSVAFVLVATVLLVIIDPLVTLWLFALVILAAPFFYWVSLRGARFAQTEARTGSTAVLAKRSLIEDVASGVPNGDNRDVELAFAKGPLQKNLDASVGQRKALEESVLITGMLMVAALGLILVQQGAYILTTGRGISSLALYLVTLRLQLTNLTKAMRVLTSVNRFYPEVARHRRFVLGIISADDDADASMPLDEELEELG